MPGITIATYTLRVCRRGTTVPEPLREIEERFNLVEILRGVGKGLAGPLVVDQDEKSTIRQKHWKVEEDLVRGLIEAGEYGYSAELVDVTDESDRFTRTPRHAEILPFYFRIYVPEEGSVGLLMLQRFGAFGILGSFQKTLDAALAKVGWGYRTEIRTTVPPEVVESLKAGRLKSIQVQFHELSSDLTDSLEFMEQDGTWGEIDVVVKAKRRGSLRLPSWIRRSPKGFRVAEIPAQLAEARYQVKLRLTYKGKERVVSLGEHGNISPYIDASEVRIGEDGHPVYASIDQFCHDLEGEMVEVINRRRG